MQTTALESAHIALGARMVPFAGWNMPVQYRGILDEAKTVREHAGLFDLGHMGRVKVYGPQAEAFLQRLQTNDAAAIKPGKIRYALLLDDDGLTQDDILLYRNPDNDGFFVVINAGNATRDLERMNKICTQIRSRLNELALGLSGALNISDAMDTLITCLFMNQVPPGWLKTCGQMGPTGTYNKKTLSAWFADLVLRHKQFATWSSNALIVPPPGAS